LLDGIVSTLPGELRSRYPEGFLERRLRKGNCLVMLDGFDELGDRAARGKMGRLIADMANMYDHPDNRFVVSTRVVGYEGQLDRHSFTVRNVRDLNDEAVRELVTRHYQAMALGECLGMGEQELADIRRKYEIQAERLHANLERNEGLRALTTNPLLLSLIVLVHLVKDLPEQRHILYRDCVEILTERWQAKKRADAGLARTARPDDLKLAQKTQLLQDVAVTMQVRRREGEGHTVIRRDEVEATVAARLPEFISAHLPEDPEQRAQECAKRAGTLLDDIFEESGILVEKGLDEVGEPVVGFSHLTFHEYLTAAALRAQSERLQSLLSHLFDSEWREVLLLYISMGPSGDLIRACMNDAEQPLLVRYLLAGRCLAEGAVVDIELRASVMDGLCAYLCSPNDPRPTEMRGFYRRMGGEKNYGWLMGNLAGLVTTEERGELDVAPEEAESGRLYCQMQKVLQRKMRQAGEIESRYAVGCILAGIGEPRNLR